MSHLDLISKILRPKSWWKCWQRPEEKLFFYFKKCTINETRVFFLYSFCFYQSKTSAKCERNIMARKELFDCHDKLLKLSSAIAETKTKTVRKKKRFFCVYNHRRFSDLPYRVIFFFFFYWCQIYFTITFSWKGDRVLSKRKTQRHLQSWSKKKYWHYLIRLVRYTLECKRDRIVLHDSHNSIYVCWIYTSSYENSRQTPGFTLDWKCRHRSGLN